MAWVSSSSSWSQLEIGCRRSENQLQTVTHGWAAQPECERSAALVIRTLGQCVVVCPRLHLTYHTQPTSTLSGIKCERYIFIKKCVRSFIEVRHCCWLCFRVYLYMYTYSCMWLYNTGSKVWTIGKMRNCLDAHLDQIVCDKDGVVDWCIVLVEMPLTQFEECWPFPMESLPELP